MKLHFLDMGRTKYGDSILVESGDNLILVDGGHPGDYTDRDGSPGIPSQLGDLLGHGAPFRVSLLIITHCHSDHIGCLPRLVRDGILQADWALVADEGLGFGRPSSERDDPLSADLSPDMRRAIAALGEESLADIANDAELAQLIEDAASLEDNYKEMLATLESSGTRLVRYGRDDHTALVDEFRPIGLNVIGPTTDHLLLCADSIRQLNADAVAFLSEQQSDADAPHDAVALYRLLVQSESDASDRPGIGAAKNDQSIVIALNAGGWKALLTGDMQFAESEVPGLDDVMSDLRDVVAAEGPFDLVKTAHHSSYNGVDESIIEAFGARTLVHSGGWNDPGHPSANVLRMLRRMRGELVWARTDKNGQITASFSHGEVKLDIARGRLNNAAANRRDDAAATSPPSTPRIPAPRSSLLPPLSPGEASPLPATATTPPIVEVIARVPHVATRVTLTIDVEPGVVASRPVTVARTTPPGIPESPDPTGVFRLAGGRQIPRLLCVTNKERLARNLGQIESTRALDAIRNAGHRLLDSVAPDVQSVASQVKAELQSAGQARPAGVLLLGGYDVIPAQRLDVLSPSLRNRLNNPRVEPDQFIVWSDDVYGCIDGDDLPDLPVSRIPDGKSPALVFRALSTGSPLVPTRFSVRNLARPFATEVFADVPGAGNIEVSELFSPANFAQVPNALAASHVYLMLHGADFDATRFWGETQAEDMYEALTIANIPTSVSGAVFTGCCWGAMPVNTRASRAQSSASAGPRTPANSLALSFLLAGARAFVGCTGVHYSPTVPPYNYFGGPMHRIFWREYVQQGAAAPALFEAKRQYLSGIPHRRNGSAAAIAQDEAIELKIMRQYTCLGLGW